MTDTQVNPQPASGEVTREQFTERFVTRMMTYSGAFDGTSEELRAYAEEAAPTYWDDPDQREEGPEECAESDVGYWEEG